MLEESFERSFRHLEYICSSISYLCLLLAFSTFLGRFSDVSFKFCSPPVKALSIFKVTDFRSGSSFSWKDSPVDDSQFSSSGDMKASMGI